MSTVIKAILFDMDGVLIDAKEWHYQSLNRALAFFGMEINRHEHLAVFDGLPTRRKLELLSLEKGLPTKLHSFINELKQIYTVTSVNMHCKPAFAQEYALSRLKHDGYRLAVCSNSTRATVKLMMEKANLAKYLDLMLSNEDVEKPKPDPQIYLQAMNRFALAPQECLIVEDNENGLKAAYASSAHVLKVTTVHEANYFNIMHAIKAIGSPALSLQTGNFPFVVQASDLEESS